MNQEDDKTRSHVILTKGTTVSQYRIIDRIGAGGMGEVYLAKDTKLDRQVALKFLSFQHSQDEELKARFMREAQAVAKLSHPNIVHIYEVGEHDKRPYFAMEHLEGQSLHKFAHDEPLSISEIISIAIGICEGLNKAHQMGIVHRDIKTSNIVLDADGHPRILDFGLATIAGTEKITKKGSTVGTVAYLSPERVEGKKADQRSDLFSLGVVLYELIAGRTPFRRDSEAATLNAIVNDESEPLARYRSGVSDGLQQIVDKLLEKDPKMRYQTAGDVAADLLREKRLLDSGDVSSTTRSRSAYRRTGLSGAKKLILSGSSLAVLIVLALVLKPWKFSVAPSEEAVASENRLAVMYFDNLIDPTDSTRLGEIVTNLLITDLSESEHLQVVSSQRMYDILKQLGKEGAHAVDRQTATQIAEIAGARWMLTGTILQMAPKVVVTTQIIDVKSGQIETSQRSTSAENEDIFAQVDGLSAAIREDLSIPGLASESTDRPLSEVSTDSPEAYRYFLEGMDQLRKMYSREAKESFLKAVELDSTYAMAHYLLALTWGDEDHLRKAVKYSDKATKQYRLHIMALSDKMAGDIDGAIATLSQLVKEYPDDKIAYMLAGAYYSEKGQLEEGRIYIEKAIEFDPQDKILYNMLAYIYKDMREYDKAIEALDKYVEIVPDEPNPYDSRGEMYAAAGKFDLAVASYREALAKDPGFESALQALTVIYTYLREYDKADSCARALVNDADKEVRSIGRAELAITSAHQGKLKKAVKVLDDAIAADSLEGIKGLSFAVKFTRQGLAYNVLGKHEEALAKVEEARRLLRQAQPDATFPFTGEYVQTLAVLDKIDQAIGLLEEAKPTIESRNDKFAEASLYLAYGRIEMTRGNYAKAIEYLKRAVPLNKRIVRPRVEYYLAKAYVENDQPAEAIPLLKRFTTQIESLKMWVPMEAVPGHYYLGMAYEMQGNSKNAIKQYETFLDFWRDADPEIVQLHDARERLARLKSKS